ncbi:class I SAM-dependent methyltransferase [Sphaerisporangium flaviroseum]|uniref:class I SAM-dependent methyltransferase n=1 Tax=Sphaerisporangium flaviroseum TaxID=509199 RepID=UPI0031F13FD9
MGTRTAGGCGAAGHRVTGVDLAPRMIEQAQAKLADAGLAGLFLVGDAADPPTGGEQFDMLLCAASRVVLTGECPARMGPDSPTRPWFPAAQRRGLCCAVPHRIGVVSNAWSRTRQGSAAR